MGLGRPVWRDLEYCMRTTVLHRLEDGTAKLLAEPLHSYSLQLLSPPRRVLEKVRRDELQQAVPRQSSDAVVNALISEMITPSAKSNSMSLQKQRRLFLFPKLISCKSRDPPFPRPPSSFPPQNAQDRTSEKRVTNRV
jgi:hypothetical protein